MATPKDEQRYTLSLSLDVNNGDKDVMSSDTRFVDLHYNQVVALEDCWVQMLNKVVDLGYGEAVERGADAAGSAAARKEIRGK